MSYEDRFLYYIRGGKPTGSIKTNQGCRDKTPPRINKPIPLRFELYFGGHSRFWGGAAAFIRQGGSACLTLGRMYLITDEQFNDVVLQENDHKVDGSRFVPPFEQLRSEPEIFLPGDRLYGHLLHLGNEGGQPLYTFTTARLGVPIAPPSEAYLKIIIKGLKETYPAMTNPEIVDYLEHADGVKSAIPVENLNRWVLG